MSRGTPVGGMVEKLEDERDAFLVRRRGRVVVFVDGSPYHRDYVQAADDRKRKWLKALGYRVVVVRTEDPEVGLDDLAGRLGG